MKNPNLIVFDTQYPVTMDTVDHTKNIKKGIINMILGGIYLYEDRENFMMVRPDEFAYASILRNDIFILPSNQISNFSCENGVYKINLFGAELELEKELFNNILRSFDSMNREFKINFAININTIKDAFQAYDDKTMVFIGEAPDKSFSYKVRYQWQFLPAELLKTIPVDLQLLKEVENL